MPPIEDTALGPPVKLTVRERIDAAANTVLALSELTGKEPEVQPEEETLARDLFVEGRDPTPVEMQMPGSVLKLKALLDEYDHSLIKDAGKIRNYVVNRLIEESQTVDPKVRIKALELLGRLSDVGAFTEKHVVSIVHQPTAEIENRIKEALDRLKNIQGGVIQHTNKEENIQDVEPLQ